MLFNSVEFLIFFTLFFITYWRLSRRTVMQNVLLLGASYLFYGWWDARFLLLIIVTTLTTYATALAAVRGHRRLWTATNITVNLGILVYFKYLDFFSQNLARLLGAFGWNVDWVTLDILLPVGISFYTFQAIGYSIDIYRGTSRPERNLLRFATFIAYFPQLVAGPIERSTDLLPQIATPRRWDYPAAVDGLRETLWGLFKKVAVADPCGIFVNNCFNGTQHQSVGGWTLAAILFSCQIYFDFSGYSNIARGVSRMLGIRLVENFHAPYFSRDPAEFWRRWHISLMRWFRDYVYIPLGGSRKGTAVTCRNIAIVFLLSGLWHGADWNFIIWGAYWAVINIIYRLLRRGDGASSRSTLPIFATVTLTVAGWVIFRASGVEQMTRALAMSIPGVVALAAAGYAVTCLWRRYSRLLVVLAIAGAVTLAALMPSAALSGLMKAQCIICAAIVFIAEWHTRHRSFPLAVMPSGQWMRLLIYWGLILCVLTADSEGAQFIYFQF